MTSEINGIFCHSSMVDRIATMLNYFLGTLVGPKKENFKVKDKKEYEFDPAHTVKDICQIYINLKNSEEFCMAVLQDGRSYSSKLFPFAENVLSEYFVFILSRESCNLFFYIQFESVAEI